jgi:1-acyl-sn-glycerol-3-phosphate acyltransferase
VKSFVLKIYDYLSAHKGLAGLLLAVLLALSAWSASRLHFEEDISAFLPKDSREQLQASGGDEKMAVFFRGGTAEERKEALYAFQDRWEEAFPDIYVYEGSSEAAQVFDFLNSNWPYFLQPEDYVRMDSLLASPGYIPAKLQEDRESLVLGNPFTAKYLRSDPLGLYSPVLNRLQAAQPEALQDTDILFFDSPYGSTESALNGELLSTLKSLKEETAQAFPSVQITSTGGPEVAVENSSRIKTDSFLALAVALLLICIVLWLSYKRVQDVLWILVSIAVGAVFALGIIACFKASVSIIVLGIGCTVIGIAVNYPLHYIDHLKYQPDRREALAEQVNPLLTGNITTVGAFLGLLLLKSEALHDFGFIGAMMLVGTILFVLVFLPVFMPVYHGERKVIKLDPGRYFHPGENTRRVVFLAFLALTVVFFFTGKKLQFDSNLHNINYMTAEQSQGFALLESLSPAADAFPLPSLEEQQERIGLWKEFWNRHQDLPDLLIDEGLKAGFTAHGFQPFFDAVEATWEPQERAYFQPVDFAPQENAAGALVSALSEDFDTIGLVCSLIVLIFLWISFGSLELTLVAFLPLAVSWIWIRGIMGLTGLQFNIVNIILATFIFGMGDDYSIFITEGLEYEYKTGKKILHSYSNAVVLSAIIMFIGIGVLAFAKHPALRSLGLVTVIGMVTVVAMACYLPPIVYRWLHFKHGKPRPHPLTIGGMLATFYIVLQMLIWMSLLSLLALFFPKGPAFNKVVRRVASWAIRIVPGCRYTLKNPHGEDFSKPAIYICNHQSHLDVLALIALHPKLIFMTNDWVWKFPFYGAVIRKAGYFPASWGLSVNSEHVKKMVAEGYSVAIFPEGTRTLDGRIGRFHRGAFLAARELGMDILPILIRGFHEALPKHDFFLRPHPLSLEIGERVKVPQESDIAELTRRMRHFYVDWYEKDA